MIGATRYSASIEIQRQTQISQEITKLQTSVSTGQRLTVGSDDPTASARVADIRQTQADQLVWTNNANTGASIASAVDTNLSSVATILDRAKDLVLSGSNDTASADDRAAIASELRGLANDVTSYSQATDPTGRPLFPTDSPLQFPVSDTLSLPATASRDSVFTTTTAAGSQSLSDILNAAADAMEGTDPTQRSTDINASITAIDAGAAHLSVVRSDQGVREQRFSEAKDDLTSNGELLTDERNGLQQTDLPTAVSQYQALQTTLQAAQTLFAQTNKSSLFDLLG